MRTGDEVTSEELLGQLGTVPGLSELLKRLDVEVDDRGPVPARVASAVEFALEGLHLTRRLAKDVDAYGRTVYGSRDDGGSPERGGRG
ncbi:MAG: hypothetical protein U0Q15_15080 [Kineosporiaceae bacterium]